MYYISVEINHIDHVLDNPCGTQTLGHVLVMVKHVNHVKQVT
jgi:hypothetical protein